MTEAGELKFEQNGSPTLMTRCPMAENWLLVERFGCIIRWQPPLRNAPDGRALPLCHAHGSAGSTACSGAVAVLVSHVMAPCRFAWFTWLA